MVYILVGMVRPSAGVFSAYDIMEKTNFVFDLNLDTYSLESVYQAAYSMLDKLYFYFDKRNAKTIVVEIKSKEDLPAPVLEKMKGEFLNELINSELRVLVAKRTRKVREALIAQALIGASADKADYIEDPLGIALPWEEKYGDKKEPKKDKYPAAGHKSRKVKH